MPGHEQKWWAKPTRYSPFYFDDKQDIVVPNNINVIPLQTAQSCIDGILAMTDDNGVCCTSDPSCRPRMWQADQVDTFTLYG